MSEHITIKANRKTKQFKIVDKDTPDVLKLLKDWMNSNPKMGEDKSKPNPIEEYEITIRRNEDGNIIDQSDTGNADLTKVIIVSFYTDVKNGFVKTEI